MVHTAGFLSNANRRAGVYASKRLALAARPLLEPLGFGGWKYEGTCFRTCGAKFPSEVMLWDAPARVRYIGDVDDDAVRARGRHDILAWQLYARWKNAQRITQKSARKKNLEP